MAETVRRCRFFEHPIRLRMIVGTSGPPFVAGADLSIRSTLGMQQYRCHNK